MFSQPIARTATDSIISIFDFSTFASRQIIAALSTMAIATREQAAAGHCRRMWSARSMAAPIE